jgi:hypothetical protein
MGLEWKYLERDQFNIKEYSLFFVPFGFPREVKVIVMPRSKILLGLGMVFLSVSIGLGLIIGYAVVDSHGIFGAAVAALRISVATILPGMFLTIIGLGSEGLGKYSIINWIRKRKESDG